MIAIGLILAVFAAALAAFVWTGIRGALGHYAPARPEPQPVRQTEPEAAEEAA